MLAGKNIVVTGSIQGIGRATLDYFSQNHANVWACALQPSDEFEAHCQQLARENGVWVRPVYFNLLDQEQIKAAVKEIMKDKQPVDGLVNIAGMTKDAIFHMVSMDDLHRVFEVNFFSQIYFTQSITKLMLRNPNKSSVVFVSSITAIDGNVGQLSYGASKAALIGAMKTLSKELASKGIRVNCIAPGVIDTDMNKVVPQEVLDEKLNISDLKRIGKPEEVASTLAFLVSDLSTHITGQVLRIDGGIK
jgi:3-oxoacyl-[acyl-carrier protein] reductase